MISAVEYNTREIKRNNITAICLMAFIDANNLVAAVKVFQAAKNLLIDGKLGPKTRAALTKPKPSMLLLPGPVYEPMRGGCFWSGNAFVPEHDHDCAIYTRDPKTGKRNRCNCDFHGGRDGFKGPKGPHGWPDSGDEMIIAIAAGEVVSVGWQSNGLWIKINHGFSVESLWGHMNGRGLVKRGEEIVAGQDLAPLWGYPKAPKWKGINPPHIHGEIKINGRRVDTAKFLKANNALVLPEESP
jgi:murein DD-endopeptidase MepM/ murein hydrolase activator NlpD